MAKIYIDYRELHWTGGGGGSFYPNPDSALECHGDRALLSNPQLWEGGKVTWSARVIVGFKRRGKKPATMNQLVRVVRQVRTKQAGNPSSSFLFQRGIYRHSDSGEIVDEPGAQVLIINTFGATPKEFERQITELAEVIADKLDQAEVIVEIQRNGVSKHVFGVGP